MNNTNTNNKTVVLNPNLANFLPRPFIPRNKRGRRPLGQQLKPILDANRPVIAKLRQRHFSWTEIGAVLNNNGVKCSLVSLTKWSHKVKMGHKSYAVSVNM